MNKVFMKDLQAGDKIVTDGGFTCMPEGVIRTVFQDEDGRLYICCDEGKHYLDGQEDFDDPENKPLVGLYYSDGTRNTRPSNNTTAA